MQRNKILIVEDENIVALNIKKNLEAAGYEVPEIYSSGEEAIGNFPFLKPDLVLMDILLKGEMDGIQSAEILRSEYHVPVVFLTAYADEETINRAIQIEPFGYIVKPFTERDLRLTVELALYRHKMAKALRESEERYRSFFDNDLSGNFVTDSAGKIIECNNAFLRLIHCKSMNDAKGLGLNALFPDSSKWEQFREDLQKKRMLEHTEINLKLCDNSNGCFLANVVGSFHNEELVGIQGYFTDIAERKQLEEQLRQAHKMEAIGRLAGGIAHDFNNIITVVMGYTSLAKEKTAENSSVEYELQGIQQASLKASNLTRQLLTFSRGQQLKPEIIDIHELIKNMENMLKRLMSGRISIQLYLNATRPYVHVDPGQIEQVLLNLSLNARDAMPSGGRITIATENCIDPGREYGFTEGKNEKGYLVLSISDTGMGIDEKIKSKIFEPFFTTKQDSEGTGLGLATVYGVIQQSGGSIKVASETGKGSTFNILLPLSGETLEGSIMTPDTDLQPGGKETILLVEDEKPLRELFSHILTRAGYTVFPASNAGEAILIFENKIDSIQLLITDLIMPHMNGNRLAERLVRQSPSLKILLISGYVDDLDQESCVVNLEFLLKKPFEPSLLLRRVREILDNTS